MTATRPKIEWLEAFVAFAEHLNFTHAARSIGLSQPALHVQVRKLTETIGAPLYRREGRRLDLTPAGVETLAFARELCERTDAFVHRLHPGVARPVVLCAGEGAFLYLLDEVVEELARSEVGALRLRVADAEGTLAAVRSGAADLGVCPLLTAPEDLEVRWIADVGLALALPPDHPLAARARIPLAALAGRPLVVPPPGPIQAALAGVDYVTAVEVRGWPLALHFAALGVGLAVVNDVCRAPEGLCLRPLEAPLTRFAAIRRRAGWRSDHAERVWGHMS